MNTKNFKYAYSAKVIVQMLVKPLEGKSTLEQIDITLMAPGELKPPWLDRKGRVTLDGVKPISQAFIQGLNANIKNAHHAGFWEKQEHYDYIVAEIKRAFESNAGTPYLSDQDES